MKIMLEKETEDFLEKEGFKVVQRKFIKRIEELKNLKLSFPWVMKVGSRNIIHKSKEGGVILNVKNLSEAEKNFIKLSKFKGFEGIMVQEQILGEKIILGIKNTEEFGQVAMVGNGGVDVEKIKDISFRVMPLKEKDAYEMLSELKLRIKDRNIKENIIKNLLNLSELSEKHPEIQELDVNPLLVDKNKATIVDSRMIID